MNKVSLKDNYALSSHDEECVITVHTDITWCKESVCIADECEKSIHTFNKRYDINPIHYTANVKILVDMFNSFNLSSNPQKV